MLASNISVWCLTGHFACFIILPGMTIQNWPICFGSGSTAPQSGPSAAPGVLMKLRLPVEKNAINTWLKLGSHWSACYLWMIGIVMMSVTESTYTKKVAEFTPRFTLFGLTAHVIIQNWIFTFRLAVRSLHFLMICSNCFWWYLSFGHSNMESWMSKCICGGHTKTHDMAGKKGFAI